jgi:hypothetical protein
MRQTIGAPTTKGSKMISWNFPLNNDGKVDGLNDPGIETFRDDPLRALAREINQNSSDAKDKASQKPVEVHFDLIDFVTAKFPDLDKFRKTLNACERYWAKNASAKKFFARAKEVMGKKTIPVLKISDFNTTGLSGAEGDHTSNWVKLTRSVGDSDKEGGAGGSFGIGKYAPFASSDIRTVFYGTKDQKGKFAFQGVARLVTHEQKGEETQGTGYFGVNAKNRPITLQGDIPTTFRRKQIGTDIYVAGFHAQHGDWAEDIIKSVLENFFVAIHEGRLIVKVQNVVLNQSTIAEHIGRYSQSDQEFRGGPYYEALTSDDAHLFIEEDFEGLGRLELKILVGKDYPKRIAMVRSTGMKIYDKGSFQTPVRFAGVLIAKGDKLNEVLRSMEPPSHNDWIPERHDDKEYARSLRRKLYSWINDQVRRLSDSDETQSLDAEGLSQYLPDDNDEIEADTDGAREGEKTEPLPEVELAIRMYEKYAPPKPVPSHVAQSSPNDSWARNDDGEGEPVNDSPDSGNGDNRSPPKTTHAIVEDDRDGRAPAPAGQPPVLGSRAVNLTNLRVYCSDTKTGRYRVNFEPDINGPGHLLVHVVGEVGEDPALIKEAKIGDADLPLIGGNSGIVGPIDFVKGKRVAIDVVLQDALRCALGVSAYAD